MSGGGGDILNVMADYRCPLVELVIEPHPDADRLELATASGNVCVVAKGQYNTGDAAVFIPANSLLLPEMLERLDDATRNYLGGRDKNRVRAARIRGIVSEGLLYTGPETVGGAVGADYAETLGCVKYVPPVPVSMNGLVEPGPRLAFDIENITNYQGVLIDGETVAVTEKLHGTFCCLGLHPDDGVVVTSKGYGERQLRFAVDDETNRGNLYCLAWAAHSAKIEAAVRGYPGEPVYVLGEIAGPKVQDLHYGLTEPRFFVFDVKVGHSYLPWHELVEVCASVGLETVPLLHEGEWRDGLDRDHRGGTSTLHRQTVREGCVIKPTVERRHDDPDGLRLGRVVLKSVNPDYLVRQGATEYQ